MIDTLLMTVEEVAETLRVSPSMIFKMASEDAIPAPIKVGRATRWRRMEIEWFVHAGCDMNVYRASAGPVQEVA